MSIMLQKQLQEGLQLNNLILVYKAGLSIF